MKPTRNLYLMISHTDTGIGRIIRTISHYKYNHVSLSLDPDFRNWTAFARYRQDATFYGGLVSEPVERFLAKGYDTTVRIFKLEITEKKYRKLKHLFARADQPESGLLYNYFDILAAIFRRRARIPGAYTCLGFACAVLRKSYLTIKELNDDLQAHMIYEGSLADLAADSGDRSAPYFAKIGRMRGTWRSVKQLFELIARAMGRSSTDMVTQQLR